MSIYRGKVLFDGAIMIHVIIFMHCLQLMKMTEENDMKEIPQVLTILVQTT